MVSLWEAVVVIWEQVTSGRLVGIGSYCPLAAGTDAVESALREQLVVDHSSRWNGESGKVRHSHTSALGTRIAMSFSRLSLPPQHFLPE